MINKRLFTRLDTNISANIYEASENKEICCIVRNISEYGICFETKKDEPFVTRIRENDNLYFQFKDSFRMDDKIETSVLTGRSRIKHVTTKKDKVFIGCYLNKENFRQYFRHRQLHSLYFSGPVNNRTFPKERNKTSKFT